MHSIIFTGHERKGFERVNGAYRIATVLRREGWDVEVIDFFPAWSLEELKKLIEIRNKKKKIDWIGISTTWINYSSDVTHKKLEKFLEFVNLNYPDIVIIAGGQDPNTSYKIYNRVNYIINGFGEVAIIEVLKYIYSNGSIKGIPRKNGWYVDANSFYQAWPMHDLSIEYVENDFIIPNETLSLEISRGCKFSCAFCNFPVLGIREDTTRNIENLEKELKTNYELYGVTNYNIADETLNDRDEKLAKLGNVVQNIGFDLNFNAFIRADILFSRPQQLELLARARVWSHYYGIETFNHETGKIIGKGMNPDKIKDGLLKTKDYFLNKLGLYRGTISLIYGLPKETKVSLLSGIDWLSKNWRDQNTIVFPLCIHLHTKNRSSIDRDYAEYGYRLLGEHMRPNLSDDDIGFTTKELTLWENDNMNIFDAEKLARYHRNQMYPNYFDNWKLFEHLSLVDRIEDALKLSGKDNLGEGLRLQQKAQALKEQYIQKKLSL